MKELEQEVIELLNQKGLTLTTAESCTGGLISNRLTNVSGSSKCFYLGLVTYSNETKKLLLHVPPEVIKRYGAVSEQCAIAMARQAKELLDTDLGLGVTGIAGPSGGTEKKPVGLVYIAISYKNTNEVHKFQFSGNRLEIKQQTADAALRIILDRIT